MSVSRLAIIIIISISIYNLEHHLGFAIIAAGVSTTPYYLIADDIAINCGSSGNSTALDGREWIGDFGPQLGKSTSSRAVHQYLSADPVPYMTARISRSQFTYTFHVRPGQKFIRLHFYPSAYIGFQGSNALFSVKVGPYTLLSNFSPSLTAVASGVKFFAREFCVNIDDNQQALSLTFTPSPSTSSEDIYAFVNGIEIVSMPTSLYYTRDSDLGDFVVGNKYRWLYIDNITALEMVYRLNIGGKSILPVEDLGMFRAWSDDKNYLLESSGAVSVRTSLIIKYRDIATYVAPMKVYQTAWSMSPKTQDNRMYYYNLTWKLSVNLGFRYLIRFHFCELESGIMEAGQREFNIFINNKMAETSADVIKWSGGNGVATYRDYIVTMDGDRLDNKRDIIITLKPKPNDNSGTKLSNPILNGLEIFKLSNPDNNLAGPNPMPIAYARISWTPKLMQLVLAFGIENVFATSVIIMLTLLNTIVYQLNHWGVNSCGNNTSTSDDEELCRRFSFREIQLATNNFDDAFVIGNGGFGKVYKGIIDPGAKTVAIKRLKLESQQGASEFWMEIETLSTFQHVHLVSLIGYCDKGREMIIVYEYMAHGTLADHLYKIHKKGSGNSLLDWEQRLKICIGAARGLDYLHTGRGARHGLIHRDVKSSNILLDENWVAKISDFGLSKMEAANLSRTHISTAVKGTFGYLDPEYFMTHRLTSKSDVYAFGVVLLEVLCGRPAVNTNLVEEQHSLALWAQSCIKEGNLYQIVDTNVMHQISLHCLKEFIKVATKCLCNHSSERPTMSEVVAGIEFALEQHGSVYSDREAEDINEELNSKRSPTISRVDENIAAGEAKGADLPRMKKYHGSNRGSIWGPRWDWLWRRTRLSKVTHHPKLMMPEIPCRRFSYAMIQDATRNFTHHIGHGFFSSVYVGYIDDLTMQVAIKEFLQSEATYDEFFNEFKIQSQLRHINLRPLVGYCYDESGLFLVYEYISNGNLRDHLHNNHTRPLLWKTRLQICVGAARGLNYLHVGTANKIIHRGVKPLNILLDDKWIPKFCGFGDSMLFPTSEFSTHYTSRIIGTHNYLPPEYAMTGRFSEKSDVFSFGVVLYEVLTGREASGLELMKEEERELGIWSPHIVASGRIDQIIDPLLIGQISPDCLSMFVETTIKCFLSNESERPLMLHVLRSLEIALELQESADPPADEGITNLGDPQLDYIEEESGGVLDDSTEWSFPR